MYDERDSLCPQCANRHCDCQSEWANSVNAAVANSKIYRKIDLYIKVGSEYRYIASTRRSRTLKNAEARFYAAYPQYRNERVKAFRTEAK